MKYKPKFRVLIVLLVFPFISGQSQINLENCVKSAIESHPALKKKDAFAQVNQKELDNNKILKYPMLQLSGQGKYQSDVVELNIDAPFGDLEFPEIPHYQYNLNLNASQVLFDGGSRGLKRELLMADYRQKIAGISAREREIEEAVQRLFLRILLAEKQIEVVKILQNTLEAGISQLEAGVKGGVVSEMDLQIVEAERIVLKRKLLTLKNTRVGIIQNLSTLCNMNINPDDSFLVPQADFMLTKPQRPEYNLFNAQQQSIEVQKKMAGLKTIPKLSAFGQAGYGRPGLNMLSDEWQDYYIVGLQFSWVPWDYKEVKRKKAIMDVSSQLVDYEKEAFDLQLQTAIDNILNQINLNEEIIIEDEKMVEAREEIRKVMEKRLAEGVITSSEYISELNREQNARLDLEKSKLELLANQLAYKIINGK